MMPSEPASAENCGSKLCSALVRTTCSVFDGSAAAAESANDPSTQSAIPNAQCRPREVCRLSAGSRIDPAPKHFPASTIIEVLHFPPPRPAMVPTRIIDSHTGGEPTRVVVSGGPDLGHGDMAQRRRIFCETHDAWRRAIVNEPRGSDVLVGAILCAPVDGANTCGVIFFNNVGGIGMCGHGTIGLVATLSYLGRVQPGDHRIETPVGLVTATLHPDGAVTVANVPSYRHAAQVSVEVPGHGVVHGDVAWGGNWFFLCADHGLPLEAGRVGELSAFASRVRDALRREGVTGPAGAEIDHVELVGPAADSRNDARNFVLCPGG